MSDTNPDISGTSTQQPLQKYSQNYKPWIWTLVVMAAISTVWAVYEGFQKDGYFSTTFNTEERTSPKAFDSRKFAIQSAMVPEQVKGLQTSHHTIIDSVRPAVITIDVFGTSPAAAGINAPDVRQGEVPVARVGSGFIIEPRGYVLSNYHVIAGAESLKATVYGPGGALQYPIKLVKADIRSDLALLRIQGPGPFPFATLGDSDAARTGDMILSLGNPFGFDQTVTSGMISSRNRTLKIDNVVYENLIQTDSPINRGSSGGPLVNVRGEVIGVNTAIFAPTGVFNGIGFAIPINQASELVGGVVDFNNTMPDVPAGQLAAWARCGRQIGNTFRQADGQVITPPHPYRGACVDCHPQLFGQTGPGSGQGSVGQGLGRGNGQRNGFRNSAPANQIGLRNGTGPGCLPVAGTVAATDPYLGIELVEVDAVIARQFNMVHPEGVLVNNVRTGGPAEASGLQRGDIIIRVVGRKIQNINDLNQILAGQKIGSNIELVVLRNGSRQTVKVKAGEVPFVTSPVPQVRQAAEFEWLGGEMTPLSPALTPYLKNGVYVAESGGILLMAGLKTGDVIVGIDGKQVADMNTFIRLTKTVNAKRGFMLDVVRAGNPLYITVKS